MTSLEMEKQNSKISSLPGGVSIKINSYSGISF